MRKALQIFVLAFATLTGCKGERGPEGVPGEIGPQGTQGPVGPQGQQGDAGPSGGIVWRDATDAIVDRLAVGVPIYSDLSGLVAVAYVDTDGVIWRINTGSGVTSVMHVAEYDHLYQSTDCSGAAYIGLNGAPSPTAMVTFMARNDPATRRRSAIAGSQTITTMSKSDGLGAGCSLQTNTLDVFPASESVPAVPLVAPSVSLTPPLRPTVP